MSPGVMQSPDYRNRTVVYDALNGDIIKTIHAQFDQAKRQTKKLSGLLKADTALESAFNVWKFIKNNLRYVKDQSGLQQVKLPARLLADGTGDCKSFSLLAASLMANMGYNVAFRYACYDGSGVPSHVYVIANNNGSVVKLDSTISKFNVEVPYTSKIDNWMRVQVLSGVNDNAVQLVRFAPAGGDIGKIRFKKFFKKVGGGVKNILKESGKVGKKVLRTAGKIAKGGVSAFKKAAFLPARKAFLAAVALNARGIATRLARAPKREVDAVWKRYGGDPGVLHGAIRNGVRKRPFFGSRARGLRGVNGAIGWVPEYMGASSAASAGSSAGGGKFDFAQLGSILAVAAPIIAAIFSLFKKAGVEDVKDPESGQSSEVMLSESMEEGGGAIIDRLNDFEDKFNSASAGGGGGGGGSFPDYPLSPKEEEVERNIDSESDGNGGLMLLALALGVYVIASK